MDETGKYHPECGNSDPKINHTLYALAYKWILAMKHRITMLKSTDPKKLRNNKDPRKDA